MIGFLARRLAWGVSTLAIFVSVTFFVIQILIPYDYSVHYIRAPIEVRQEVLERTGLDQPIINRWATYMAGLATLDLGEAWGGGDVFAQVVSSMPLTLVIFVLGGSVAYLIGSWLGRVIAWKQKRALSGLTTGLLVFVSSLFPPFLVFALIFFLTGPMLDLRVALGLPVDSLDLWRGRSVDEQEVASLVGWAATAALIAAIPIRRYARRERLRWMVGAALPVCVLAVAAGLAMSGLGPLAVDLFFRADRTVNLGSGSPLIALIGFVMLSVGESAFVVRTGMQAEKHADYVLVNRAKGLPEWVLRDRHAGANTSLPALTRFSYGLPLLLTGLIVIEREMMLGGLSTLFFDALQAVDVPVIMGVIVLLGGVGIGIRLILDVTQALVDPRLRPRSRR